MSQNKNLILKIALLSTCLVSTSLNAVTCLVPEMAQAFPTVSLSTIELIATIPSLFQMVGVLGEQVIAKKLGHKGAMLLALLFCAVGGVIPVFLPLFPVIFVTRCFFGTGCGLLMSSLLTLIVHFFDGRTRSTMIGLNGGISGMGSAFATFMAGQLLVFGWNVSFSVYFLGFAVALLVLIVVPKVSSTDVTPTEAAEKKNGRLPLGLWGLGVLMFVSVMLATMYVIKASTLITDYGYGTAKEGSLAITFLSLGSFAAGLTYGSIRAKLGNLTLALAFIICVAGFLWGICQQPDTRVDGGISAGLRISHLHALPPGAGQPQLRRLWRDGHQSCAGVPERWRIRHPLAGESVRLGERGSKDTILYDRRLLRGANRGGRAVCKIRQKSA